MIVSFLYFSILYYSLDVFCFNVVQVDEYDLPGGCKKDVYDFLEGIFVLGVHHIELLIQ